MKVFYFDRTTGEQKIEKIYGEKALRLLYSSPSFFSPFFRFLFSKIFFISRFYGWLQNRPYTRRKIASFVKTYEIDSSEFLKPLAEYDSFNDFFCRKLKPESRHITPGDSVAIIPADGRYLVYEDISRCEGIFVKGKKFSTQKLLQDTHLAEKYYHGSLVIGRLCPIDYHRFHFPTSGRPSKPKLINGALFSVNPIALMHNIHIFTENKRVITPLEETPFGTVLLMEVGATNVGTIHQTFEPNKTVCKGDEKGYFSFGGSSVILLFPPKSILFCSDLLQNSTKNIETLCKLGQPLGQKS